MNRTKIPGVKYALNAKGHFIIDQYNQAKPFSNFFPGIAGLWGKPMWVFYVNRGQCIASFGVESKSDAIMEFQPANKAYRLTPLQGFRTFIKVHTGKETEYWEPFQMNVPGSNYRKKQSMAISAHDLTIEEANHTLGLKVSVNYFTMPDEPYSALVRKVTVKNLRKTKRNIEIIDGMPVIVPFGLKDHLNKNISRTVEAWVKVRNLENKAPYYHLNVEVDDKPEVTHIMQGNFFFSFDIEGTSTRLLEPIAEAYCIFGESYDFSAPDVFLDRKFLLPKTQQTDNRSPCAFCYDKFVLKSSGEKQIVSVFGNAQSVEQLNSRVASMMTKKFVQDKIKRNEDLIGKVKNFAFTNSSSREFNLYAEHTFLDNILRGGLPISLKTSKGDVAFNVYSRKHGDLERDYNHFVVAPTYYSQGNGNYRDVNQNRRNDTWFNLHVRDNHLINFFNLGQADGYNPLIVKGTTFLMENQKVNGLLTNLVKEKDIDAVRNYVTKDFRPGDLLEFIDSQGIGLSVEPKEFLGRILEHCSKQELAEHGEGFWTDHWTYNLDLVESYLALYPEDLQNLLLERTVFNFYHNTHYVLPRDQRYILTDRGVRQYKAVVNGSPEDTAACEANSKLKTMQGEGSIYQTHLACKLLCLIANKIATLDPSGIGVDMEADKPNWYDSLNGLPGLLGSSLSETLEVKRFSRFLLDAFQKLSLDGKAKIRIFDELATFISGLTNLLALESDAFSYWQKSNDIKEHYRQRIRKGIDGAEKDFTVNEIKNFLKLVIAKADKAAEAAKDAGGFLSTYFYHDVVEYEVLDKSGKASPVRVRPIGFRKHALPLFLEGYVHAMRVEGLSPRAKKLYGQVRRSGLFDKKLKMYKVNCDLSGETEEIGRTRIFPASWLENQSIWLHMEYKFILELLRDELYEEFYENFRKVLIPFQKPSRYGRSILENSSFIVSSAHEDESLHGQGFVARLSGSTAEFLHIWLYMNAGKAPFALNVKGELTLSFKPALEGELFTKKPVQVKLYQNKQWVKYDLPKNTYAFNFLGSTLVVYHNPKRFNTFEKRKCGVKKMELTFFGDKKPVCLSSQSIPAPYASDIRDRKCQRIDVYLA